MRVQTTGTNTCGMIALSRFGHIGTNEKAKGLPIPSDLTSDLKDFVRSKIITVRQEGHYLSLKAPLEHVMKAVEKMEGEWGYYKVYICVLNHTQYYARDSYWPNELEKWGFKLANKFRNVHGEPNYFFMRVPEKLVMED